MKAIAKILQILLLSWFILFIFVISVHLKQVRPYKTYGYMYDVFEVHDLLVVTSIQGSGEFAYVDYYHKRDVEKVKELYLKNDGESWLELHQLRIPLDDEESISDAKSLIVDIDFDKSFEVIKYSGYSYKVSKDINQINPDSQVTEEGNFFTRLFIHLFCLVGNAVSYLLGFFLILVNIAVGLVKRVKKRHK